MKPRWYFEEEITAIPEGSFVVTFWGRVGLFVRFTGKRGRVQFGAMGPYANYKCLRLASQADVDAAGLKGVGGNIGLIE